MRSLDVAGIALELINLLAMLVVIGGGVSIVLLSDFALFLIWFSKSFSAPVENRKQLVREMQEG
jgi:predicted exporter